MSHELQQPYARDDSSPSFFKLNSPFLDLSLFKTQPCPISPVTLRTNCQHDRRSCPYYHNDHDRRRAEPIYNPQQCQFFFAKEDDLIGVSLEPNHSIPCPQNDSCTKCHNKYELLYHPKLYKTRFCSIYTPPILTCTPRINKDAFKTSQTFLTGKLEYSVSPHDSKCPRGYFCAFAHSRDEIQRNVFTQKDEVLLQVLDLLPKSSPFQYTPKYDTMDYNLQILDDITIHEVQEFFMYKYKILWCPYGKQHSWHQCMYSHTLHDCRRHPFISYASDPCELWNKTKIDENDKLLSFHLTYSTKCFRSVQCALSHGPKEQLYHPLYYKTKMCHDFYPDFPNQKKYCSRGSLCAFYHFPQERRLSSNYSLKQSINDYLNKNKSIFSTSTITTPVNNSLSKCTSPVGNVSTEVEAPVSKCAFGRRAAVSKCFSGDLAAVGKSHFSELEAVNKCTSNRTIAVGKSNGVGASAVSNGFQDMPIVAVSKPSESTEIAGNRSLFAVSKTLAENRSKLDVSTVSNSSFCVHTAVSNCKIEPTEAVSKCEFNCKPAGSKCKVSSTQAVSNCGLGYKVAVSKSDSHKSAVYNPFSRASVVNKKYENNDRDEKNTNYNNYINNNYVKYLQVDFLELPIFYSGEFEAFGASSKHGSGTSSGSQRSKISVPVAAFHDNMPKLPKRRFNLPYPPVPLPEIKKDFQEDSCSESNSMTLTHALSLLPSNLDLNTPQSNTEYNEQKNGLKEQQAQEMQNMNPQQNNLMFQPRNITVLNFPGAPHSQQLSQYDSYDAQPSFEQHVDTEIPFHKRNAQELDLIEAQLEKEVQEKQDLLDHIRRSKPPALSHPQQHQHTTLDHPSHQYFSP